VTLRRTLGEDASCVHEQVERLLDSEDAVILLFDGHRAVNYVGGFGLSPSQHELMALALERTIRATGAAAARSGVRRLTARPVLRLVKTVEATTSSTKAIAGVAEEPR
jgi:hypothetical protein